MFKVASSSQDNVQPPCGVISGYGNVQANCV